MTEFINRQAAIDAIKILKKNDRFGFDEYQTGKNDMIDYIADIVLKEMPSEKSEQKAGRWIDCASSEHWKCSECGDRAPMVWSAENMQYSEWLSPFCPYCGAKMK